MEASQALLLAGLLQGLLEWLPVSSSGQVVLLLGLAGARDPVHYALALHAGTGLAALLRYRGLVARGLSDPRSPELAALVVPLAVGAPLAAQLEGLLSGLDATALTALVGALLVASGAALAATGRAAGVSPRQRPGLADLAAVGVLQGLAVAPGLSRSAVVTAYLVYRLGDPLAATVYAFYTGAAAQLAAGAYGLARLWPPEPWLLAALAASAAAGYATIRAVEELAARLRMRLAAFLAAYGGLVVALNAAALAGLL